MMDDPMSWPGARVPAPGEITVNDDSYSLNPDGRVFLNGRYIGNGVSAIREDRIGRVLAQNAVTGRWYLWRDDYLFWEYAQEYQS